MAKSLQDKNIEQQLNNEHQLLVEQIIALTNKEHDLIANMANTSAVLFNGLADVNWAGFYCYKDSQLVLGPFQGQPACIRIPLGKGVCGTAAMQKKSLLVENVHEFEGHIACDAMTNSEVVVPLVHNQQLIGVLDLDSPQLERFTKADLAFLERISDILIDTLG